MRRQIVLLAGLATAGLLTSNGRSQSALDVYRDSLTNSFDDWSWASHNLANTTPVHGGSHSISVSANAWEAISFHHAPFDTAPYTNFTFWANGGAAGGQRLQIYAEYGTNAAPAYTLPGTLPAGTWQQYAIPLTTLGIANRPDFNRISLQLRSDGATGTFYVDDLSFQPNPVPAMVNVAVVATQTVATVDERHFGVNLAVWDGYYDPPNDTTTTALLQEMGCTLVRLPGGSLSDEYHWATGTTLTNTWQWAASFADLVRVCTNAGVQACVTVNYGTGTPEEAAAWVRHANVTNQLGYKYWEIGNECYGTWETDANTNPHDPYTYAVRAAAYLAQMRAADPSIKIGVVSVPGENTYSNQFSVLHPAYNARTGRTSYGWTPVLLATLKSLGVTPDFLVHHVYPEWTDPNNPAGSPDNDTTLLQSTGNWAADAADLRQQITDYFGAGGTNIELVCTENNSDAGAQGRQSTSLVNGVYYADSLAQLLKTEFKGFIWWDFRNGTDHGGYFGDGVYGWRSYGDLGMVNGLNTRHPTFYMAKLMQWFARPGDAVLNATTDYPWLSVGAARHADGSLALLVINKSLVTDLNAQIGLDGFLPAEAATVRSYGIPNDEAARTNGPAVAQDVSMQAITNAAAQFALNFPKLSASVVTLTPAAPELAVVGPSPPGQFIFQIRGQPHVRYVVQSSDDLNDWVSVSTNILVGSTLNVTNPSTAPPRKYWRAAWQP
ncbi:MAG TPA: alpha-L-arabinofuranosidase [Verrucomicrobiae bacterium]|nr:alpha-L-arabinofuranosidase [Verrucomicrobiae bacterium]